MKRWCADLKACASRWTELDPTFLAGPDCGERLSGRASARRRCPRNAYSEENRLIRSEDRLKLYYGDLDAHALAFRASFSLDKTAAAAEHQRALYALDRRIENSGDGSNGQPYQVLTAQDAFDWLRHRKIPMVGALYEGDD
jgi:hypothetical protein